MTEMERKVRWDVETIPREAFLEKVRQGKVVRSPASHGGVVHEVLRFLERNAATIDAIADALQIPRKTVINAINHLRHRYNKKIIRYYNPDDRKYYYCLQEGL